MRTTKLRERWNSNLDSEDYAHAERRAVKTVGEMSRRTADRESILHATLQPWTGLRCCLHVWFHIET